MVQMIKKRLYWSKSTNVHGIPAMTKYTQRH